MAPISAFSVAAPALGRAGSAAARAVCPAPPSCCGRPHAPLAPCGGAELARGRRAFVGGARVQHVARARPSRAVRAVLSPDRPSTEEGAGAGAAQLAGSKLLAGLLRENLEFVAGRERTGGDVLQTRLSLKDGQAPKVAVVACADSRVAPELLFRAGLGELFVMRVAGNTTCGPQVLGSLQYAIDVLGVQLVLVLGHTKCGAVAAACQHAELAPKELSAHVGAIAKDIAAFGGLGDDVDQAVEQNVAANVHFLEGDLARRGVPADKTPLVQGAVYDISTGAVSLVDGGVAANNGWLQ